MLALGLMSLVLLCCTLEVNGIKKAVEGVLSRLGRGISRIRIRPIEPVIKARRIKKVKKKHAETLHVFVLSLG